MTAQQAMRQAADAMRQALSDPSDYRADLAARTFAHDAQRSLKQERQPDPAPVGPIIRTRVNA